MVICQDYGGIISSRIYGFGDYFSSEELAKNVARAETLMRRIRRRAAEICEPINWEVLSTQKWYIYFDYNDNKIEISYIHHTRTPFNIYFDTDEHARQIIEEFKGELIWYFTEYKDRMDV